LNGVAIGEDAQVGLEAVIVTDVEAKEDVMGNPANPIGEMKNTTDIVEKISDS
jgi:serine acetyltransferase